MAKSKRRRKSSKDQLTSLAALAGDMMLSSAFVISHRTSLMIKAGAKPRAHDRKEMTRMVQEKFDAGQEAAWDVSRYLAMNALTAKPLNLATGAARKAMRPFHKRAKANARRLD